MATTSNDIKVDVTEPLLTINNKNQPLVTTDENYATLLIIRLILMEPGLNQLDPDMGVGLVSKFRYSTEVDMNKLSNSIKSQIEKYLPQFTLADVKCELGDSTDGKVIKIYIRSEELNMYIPINTVNGQVLQSSTAKSLVDIQ